MSVYLLAPLLAGYVLVAAAFLVRLKNWVGVLLTCGAFVVFPYAASYDLATAAGVWLLAGALNVPFQNMHFKKFGVGRFSPSVAIASLFIWPIQGSALVFSAEQEQASRASRRNARKKIGASPATVSGTVTFTHHIGSDRGEDMVWLDSCGDQEFYVSASLYDEIGIQEGAAIELSIEERSGEMVSSEEPVLWATAGKRF